MRCAPNQRDGTHARMLGSRWRAGPPHFPGRHSGACAGWPQNRHPLSAHTPAPTPAQVPQHLHPPSQDLHHQPLHCAGRVRAAAAGPGHWGAAAQAELHAAGALLLRLRTCHMRRQPLAAPTAWAAVERRRGSWQQLAAHRALPPARATRPAAGRAGQAQPRGHLAHLVHLLCVHHHAQPAGARLQCAGSAATPLPCNLASAPAASSWLCSAPDDTGRSQPTHPCPTPHACAAAPPCPRRRLRLPALAISHVSRARLAGSTGGCRYRGSHCSRRPGSRRGRRAGQGHSSTRGDQGAGRAGERRGAGGAAV